MSVINREQIADWVEKLLDDSLTPDEFDELQQLLMDQPEACELYLDLMQQNAHLQLNRGHLPAISLRQTQNSSEPLDRPIPFNKRSWLSAVAVLAASLLFIAWWYSPITKQTQTVPSIARITDSSDAQWGDCSLPTAVGSQLSQGRLTIDRGLATIQFSSGVEVTLESPAELVIESPLSGKLLAGTAVINVPDSAHGFTLTTPTAVAIDHGTAFAVTVDTSLKTSSIEVLDGEVEVRHTTSDTSMRLKEKQRLVASETELSDSLTSIGEPRLFATKTSTLVQNQLHRITTADGNGAELSISRGGDDDVKKNSHAELVLIKNPFEGYERFARKGYFRFDLASIAKKEIASARFMLTLMPSGLGFASKVQDCDFAVYGLEDETGDDWPDDALTWQSAPANLDGAAGVDASRVLMLGRFTVRRGVQHGQIIIEGNELTRFLNADTNQSVTLIVVRETKEIEPGGLVHGFANRFSSAGTPPTLIISTGRPDSSG